jgi:MFS family permease
LNGHTNGLTRNLWLYLIAGALWSFGLMAFFLVYNLHLLNLGHREDFMGQISGSMTLGSLAFTFPARWLLNRFGSNRVIQTAVACTAVILLFRVLSESSWALTLLAFLNGSTIAAWMVATPLFLTQNTLAAVRSRAFSLSYGTSIGMGALAGLAVGLVHRFQMSLAGAAEYFKNVSVERIILTGGCLFVSAALLLLLLLQEEQEANPTKPTPYANTFAASRGAIRSRSFLARLLVVLLLWSLFVGSFSPFFNVFFYRRFNQSLGSVGIIFSLSQCGQLLAVLSMPWFVARVGRVRAIFFMQILAALFLPLLLLTHKVQTAGLIYLIYLSFQAMSEPALENFIMDSVFPEERSLASSLRYMTLFLMQALSVWLAGLAIARFGYEHLIVVLAGVGVSAALSFYASFRYTKSNLPTALVT